MAPGESLGEARRLLNAGEAGSALALLRQNLRDGLTPGPDLDAAGRLVVRALAACGRDATPTMRVSLLGQATTPWLTRALTALAWRHGIAVLVHDGAFDQVIQELASIDASAAPDVVVLLPWNQRLLAAEPASPDERIEHELAFWRQAWRIGHERGVRRLIQIGFDWTDAGASGFHLATARGGDIDTVRRANAALRAAMPADAYFVSLEDVSGMVGRARFYDARQTHWTRQPFSAEGLAVLAAHLTAGLRALTTGPRKVLVVDLDNTLWGGVVGEAGATGVDLGETPSGNAFRAFQRHLKSLTERGVVLAACSKNELADARAPFEQNPDMVLRLDDFAYFVANWEPKAGNIRRIAHDLGLGLDSIVFFDDSAFERDLVRRTLPEVEVVDVPSEPADYIAALQRGLWFEACRISDEDRRRSQMYAALDRHRHERTTADDVDGYLASLSMRAEVRDLGEPDMTRAVQMLAKTNQFNLTLRRHTAHDLAELLSTSGAIALTLRLSDRHGDHGLVALVVALPDVEEPRWLRIDSMLMSCRVIGRTVEEALMTELARRAAAAGWHGLIGEFVPGPRNDVVGTLYERLGFTPGPGAAGGHRRFHLALPADAWPTSHVNVMDARDG